MASLAFPVSELQNLVINEARPKTVRIARYSRVSASNVRVAYKMLWLTAGLGFLFPRLIRKQRGFLESLLSTDFNSCDRQTISKMADTVSLIVEKEREILEHAQSVGAEIRAFWPLRELQSQVEHLDSIAESLHAATSVSTIALLALASEQVLPAR